MNVTCEACGHGSTVQDPQTVEVDGVAGPVEVVWKCPECGAANREDGHDGEPGEGALNPAASALSDDQLAEAYERRINVGGSVGPEGGMQ